MSKKQSKADDRAQDASTIQEASGKEAGQNVGADAVVIDLDKPAIKAAIDAGKALIDEGKSKADAARAIFDQIKDEPKEVIVAAFVKGATLTEKGALTYWYNCRRKAAKEQAAEDR